MECAEHLLDSLEQVHEFLSIGVLQKIWSLQKILHVLLHHQIANSCDTGKPKVGSNTVFPPFFMFFREKKETSIKEKYFEIDDISLSNQFVTGNQTEKKIIFYNSGKNLLSYCSKMWLINETTSIHKLQKHYAKENYFPYFVEYTQYLI